MFSGMLLLGERPAFAEWMGKADFTACPRKYYPATSREDGPFATESDCKAFIERIQREFTLVCARYSCEDEAPPAAGHQMDGHIADAISAGVSGQISSGDAAGLVGLGILGNILLTPRAKTAPGSGAAERQRVQDEAKKAESADRLLVGMLETGESARAPASDGLLGQMLDTPESSGGEQSIMGSRKAGPAPRTQPRAVLKQPLVLMADPEPVPLEPVAPAVPPIPVVPPSGIDGFGKGLEHGTGCFSQNSGPICSGAAPDEWAACIDDYRRGYREGDRAAKLRIDLAYRGGQQDKAAGTDRNAASQPDAVGPCRIDIIKAYNSGFSGSPHP